MVDFVRFLIVSIFCFAFSGGLAFAQCDQREFDSGFVMNSPVCIPENPKRIVVLDALLTLGTAIDLDLPVVGAPLFKMSDKDLLQHAEKKGITSIGQFSEPDIEKILLLRPDLIIGSSFLGDGVYNMASKVAPTVFINTYHWKDYIRTVAALKGPDAIAQADEKFSRYDRRIADIRSRMPDKTVSIVRITNWDFQVYLEGTDSYAPFAILREAGVKRTPYEIGKDGETMKRPDFEELGNLTGDILLYIIGGANDSDISGRYEEVVQDPLWQLLPAVQSGHVYRVDAGTWMEFSGFVAADRILDDIEKQVIAGKPN